MAPLIRASHPPDPGSGWEPSGLDRASSFMVIRGLWLFEGGLDLGALEAGLARLLDHYPHLAGRMEAGGRRVRFTNEGVPLDEVRRPDLPLQALLDDHRQALALHAPFSKGRFRRGASAPLAARLVHLADAQALSVACSHTCLDGQSFYALVQRWGRACAGQALPPVVSDPARLPRDPPRTKAEARAEALARGWRRPNPLALLPVLGAMATGALNRRVGPVHLSEAALAGLRQEAERDAGGERLSTNDILTAHLSRCCARLHGHGPDTACSQVVVYDARGRVESVPAAYVGNASFSAVGARYRPGDSLGAVAAATRRALGPRLARPSEETRRDMALALALMDHGLLLTHFDLGAMHARRPTLCYLNSFLRLPVYDVDFGTAAEPARPVRVIPHDLADPVLFWPAPPGQGGVEVYLTGRAAAAAARLAPDDPWWAALRGDGPR